MRKILLCAAVLPFVAASIAPASAAMMRCSSDNMAKSTTAMMAMPDTPAKFGMSKEMAMANTDMSKGNMRGACMHYMKAQKMGMMQPGMGMMRSGM